MSGSSNHQTLAEFLTLHYVRSKPSSEIATLLSVPERAVIAVIESGKARLTGILGL